MAKRNHLAKHKSKSRDFASDAELQTIIDMWGKHSISDIGKRIQRDAVTVEKWARHVLFLLPKDKRHQAIKQPTLMRCQSCCRLQPLANACVECGASRLEAAA